MPHLGRGMKLCAVSPGVVGQMPDAELAEKLHEWMEDHETVAFWGHFKVILWSSPGEMNPYDV